MELVDSAVKEIDPKWEKTQKSRWKAVASLDTGTPRKSWINSMNVLNKMYKINPSATTVLVLLIVVAASCVVDITGVIHDSGAEGFVGAVLIIGTGLSLAYLFSMEFFRLRDRLELIHVVIAGSLVIGYMLALSCWGKAFLGFE